MTVVGRFQPPAAEGDQDPRQRLTVFFDRLVLRPASPETHLSAWLEALTPHNPGMRREDGVLEIPLGMPPPKGALDYLVMTREWHVSKGNMGSIVVMQRREK